MASSPILTTTTGKETLSTVASSDILTIATDEDISISTSTGNVEAKTIYFKKQTTSTALMEIVSKNPQSISVNDTIKRSDTVNYYVQNITPPQVKFGTGTPLLSQTTNISFPKAENDNFAPEKIATFLIFKK